MGKVVDWDAGHGSRFSMLIGTVVVILSLTVQGWTAPFAARLTGVALAEGAAPRAAPRWRSLRSVTRPDYLRLGPWGRPQWAPSGPASRGQAVRSRSARAPSSPALVAGSLAVDGLRTPSRRTRSGHGR